MSDYLDPENEELLKDFFDEANLQIDLFEQNILSLEHDPGNAEAVDEIFRAAHTLKGAAATVQMAELTGFTHTVEDVLDEVRSGNASVTEVVVDLLLKAIDTIKLMLSARADGSVYEDDVHELVDALHATAGLDAPPRADSTPSRLPTDAEQSAEIETKVDGMSEYEMLELVEKTDPTATLFQVDVKFDESNPMNSVGGIQVYAALKEVGTVIASEPDVDMLYEDDFYETVQYYVITSEDEESLEKHASIIDVTLGSDIKALKGPEESSAVSQPQESAGDESPRKENIDGASAGAIGQGIDDTTANTAAGTIEAKPDAAKRPERHQPTTGSVLRVDSRRIDNLLNLVSEAVINKATFSQIAQAFTRTQETLVQADTKFADDLKQLFDAVVDLAGDDDGRGVQMRSFLVEQYGQLFDSYKSVSARFKEAVQKFQNTSQNLGRITGELQEGVMQIRMVPISQIFSRFPRLVRDVSKSLGKQIRLEIQGEDTELDKSVIEDLLDPLIHCVRNSVDHGVEMPDSRSNAGKTEQGTVTLRASNEGNLIVIEVEDDGKGIDVESVFNKAVDRGIIHPNKQLSDVEAFNLIFEAGFSTADEVTDISGRGVGLDVVKKQIEKLNGNVSVWSEKGKGTRITIKLPLTLAILQGLLVRVGQEVYAIPITSVVESHRISSDEIQRIDNYEVMNVRDEVISLLRLDSLFAIEARRDLKFNYVVVVGGEEKKVGLIVDTLIGEEDVVIKPLRDRFASTPGIAGATILGNGRVALIIDVSQLLELGIAQDNESRGRREQAIV